MPINMRDIRLNSRQYRYNFIMKFRILVILELDTRNKMMITAPQPHRSDLINNQACSTPTSIWFFLYKLLKYRKKSCTNINVQNMKIFSGWLTSCSSLLAKKNETVRTVMSIPRKANLYFGYLVKNIMCMPYPLLSLTDYFSRYSEGNHSRWDIFSNHCPGTY